LAIGFFGAVTGLSATSCAGSATVASGSDGAEGGNKKVDTIVLGGARNAASPLFLTTVGCINQ
jgi:hypothetical protein